MGTMCMPFFLTIVRTLSSTAAMRCICSSVSIILFLLAGAVVVASGMVVMASGFLSSPGVAKARLTSETKALYTNMPSSRVYSFTSVSKSDLSMYLLRSMIVKTLLTCPTVHVPLRRASKSLKNSSKRQRLSTTLDWILWITFSFWWLHSVSSGLRYRGLVGKGGAAVVITSVMSLCIAMKWMSPWSLSYLSETLYLLQMSSISCSFISFLKGKERMNWVFVHLPALRGF
mmetsp:Transcript_17557/g.52840  ORF Transcript_17557/g.52840 Transcript_17557/m.52840 type:complete len:230 (-) Transcript_17557:634-1323(-)